MITEVRPIQVADIFSTNTDKIYDIPKYQREYTWGKKDWESLFTDVMENEKGYFLGSYICVNAGSIGETVLELVDGQQRFSSLTLLLAALYEKLSVHRDKMEDEENAELVNLRKEIAFRKGKNDYIPRLNLQKQNNNDEDYIYVLSSAKIVTTPISKPDNFGYRRIGKAYRFFGKMIDEEVKRVSEEEDTGEIEALFEIKNKFEKAILVGIQVDTNKDAYMLFESLNHRGVPLSALDLIKNTLIAKTASETEADNSYEKWKTILTLVGSDDYAVQERFFRQYYNAFREELNANIPNNGKKYPLGYLATKTTLIDIYEKMIRNNCQNLLNDLLKKAEYYSIIVNNNDTSAIYSEALINLERISGAPSYILLLYLLSNQEELDLTDDDIDWIIRALIIFFVRRNVTDVPGTRKLIQFFIDCVMEIRDLVGISVKNVIKEKLRDISAPDSVFEQKLSGDIYDENAEAARFILCDIEERHQTKETYTKLWERGKNHKYIWTIEHIFPEGENIPKAWIDMIANGDVELAKQYREEYVHKIGNLTITGYNSNLSNKSFSEKKERKSKDNKVVGYKNGLYLNEDVASEDCWTVEKINERTSRLVDVAQSIYDWDSL